MKLILLCTVLTTLTASIPSTSLAEPPNLESMLEGQASVEQAMAQLEKVQAENEGNPDHPAVAFATAMVGTAGWSAGDHEDAVGHFEKAIPILAEKTWQQDLWADELMIRLPYALCLREVGREKDALVQLNRLLDGTRKGIEKRVGLGNLEVTASDVPGSKGNLTDLLPTEDWLIGLLERLGEVEASLENWAAAEKAYKEAECLVLDQTPPVDSAKAALLREAWEDAARRQGKKIRPKLVGKFGNPRSFIIEGAVEIDADDIRSALARSADFVIASHPVAEFSPLLEALREGIERGYRECGFKEPSVEATWSDQEGKVVIRIVEGSRYRAGEIRIRREADTRLVNDQTLMEFLRAKKVDYTERPDRAAESYDAIVGAKQIRKPEAEAEKKDPTNIRSAIEDDDMFSLLSSRDPSAMRRGAWNEGEWIDFSPSALRRSRRQLHSAYAEEAHFGGEFEVAVVPDPAEKGLAHLEVTITSEGAPMKLEKVTVTGNRVNSREEILTYLGIAEGQELRGAWIGRLHRKLYDSGRFLGWKLTPSPARVVDGGNGTDLLIEVQEDWEAPPLVEELTPEQQALLKVAEWLNTKAGEDGDLVLSMKYTGESHPVEVTVAFNVDGGALSVRGLEHEIHVVAIQNQKTELAISSSEGVFCSEFPIQQNRSRLFFKVLRQPTLGPFQRSGSIAFGIGYGSSTLGGVAVPSNSLRIQFDPAAAVKVGSSSTKVVWSIEEGELVLGGGENTIRFDTETGRLNLIEFHNRDQGFQLTGRLEQGAVERIRDRIREHAGKTGNWLEGKPPVALGYLAWFFGQECINLLEEDGVKDLSPAEFTARAAKATRRWVPMATFLGGVTKAVGDSLDRGAGRSEAGDKFKIPMSSEALDERIRAGQYLTMLTGYGLFEHFANNVETGSWPELVMREALMVMDGNPVYLNQTVATLLDDDGIGPIGCLTCSGLLTRMRHPAALDFLAKAEAALDVEGFEKDWSLLFGRIDDTDGLGWKLLRALQQLDEVEMADLLPNKAGLLMDLWRRARGVAPETEVDALRPLARVLWDGGLESALRHTVDQTRETLIGKWDPALVAALVDGKPLARGVLRYVESVTDEGDTLLGMSVFDQVVSIMLAAEEMWATGRGPGPEFVEKQAEGLAKAFGGWEKLGDLGLGKDLLRHWTRTHVSGMAMMNEVLESGKIKEEDARRFYERSKFFEIFREIPLHTIRLDIDGNADEQRKLAAEIRERILAAGEGEARVAAFKKEAEAHSDDSYGGKGGDGGSWGWIMPEHVPPSLRHAIAQVEDNSMSEVMTVPLGDPKKDYLYLILISDERRKVPFEKVKSQAVLGAYLEGLRAKARIKVLDEPVEGGEAPGEDVAPPVVMQLLEVVMESIGRVQEAFLNPDADADEEAEPEPFADLPYQERIPRQAAAGDPEAIYELGTFAERGIAPRDNGFDEAVKLYRTAAGKGNPSAMLRLAELHRTGRGGLSRDMDACRKLRAQAFEELRKNRK